MKISEIRKLSTVELTKESTNLRDEIVSLKLSKVMGETQNVRALKHKRKELARVMTVLGEQLSKEKI